MSGQLLFSQIVGDHLGASFDKVPFRFAERVGEIAFDIELSRKLFLRVNGNNDFRLHQRRARKIPRVFGDVLHDYHLTAAGRRAAESLAERYARVGCKAAGVGPDDQVACVRRIHQIETYPVVARPVFMQPFGDLLHGGPCRGSSHGIALEFLEKLFRRQRQVFDLALGIWSRPAGNYFRVDFSFFAVFSNCFFSASTRLEMSFNSPFAILLAAETLRALMWASRLALPNAAPTFLPTSVNLFFFAMIRLL